MKLSELKSGGIIDAPIYKSKPYILTGKEKCVLSAGNIDHMCSLGSYYDDCDVSVRKHDLYLNDNTKLQG